MPPGGLPGGMCGPTVPVTTRAQPSLTGAQPGRATWASGSEQACSPLHQLLLSHHFQMGHWPCALLPIHIIIFLTPAIALLSLQAERKLSGWLCYSSKQHLALSYMHVEREYLQEEGKKKEKTKEKKTRCSQGP